MAKRGVAVQNGQPYPAALRQGGGVANQRLIFGLTEDNYQSITEVFARHPLIERVLIFGSRAKGTAKPWSDIDLAVIAPAMNDREFTELWNEMDGLPIVFKVDVLHLDRVTQPGLREKIMVQGRIFYPLTESACCNGAGD
jgi:proline iminopeptidase